MCSPAPGGLGSNDGRAWQFVRPAWHIYLPLVLRIYR